MENLVDNSVRLIKESNRILVFTGAGLSTESGIPDFRSPGGIWDRYDPSDFYYDRIVSDEKCRQRYWEMSSEYYAVMKDASPNDAHLAVRKIEDTGRLLSIVTQNIDNLHQKAGNSPDKIIEIHGTAFSVICLDCGLVYERDVIEERIKSGIKIPYCDECSGILKPHTISFGQSMPEEKMFKALTYSRECDLCIVLGSSLVVYPAASIPEQAVNNGARLMIVNRDDTMLDKEADLVIHESLGETLRDMAAQL